MGNLPCRVFLDAQRRLLGYLPPEPRMLDVMYRVRARRPLRRPEGLLSRRRRQPAGRRPAADAAVGSGAVPTFDPGKAADAAVIEFAGPLDIVTIVGTAPCLDAGG
ncbi:hypothetical protein [uncultured Massilia sp.]|uniref:hypothetical protein n=1 Tax=uncultured Massilia sp. TaxID=169973 RepID=UPI0025F3B91E|nr:hypothetical protein [uncultured Massilia sp.]